MNNNVLSIIKMELQDNKLFEYIFLSAVELVGEKNERLEKKYFDLVEMLENYNGYINYTSVLYDLNKIIVKRLFSDFSKISVLKALDILDFKEM